MKRFFVLLKLQFKKSAKAYLAVFLVMVVLFFGLFAVAGVFLNSYSSGENQSKMRIGLVGDVSDSYLGFGVNALKNIDSTKNALELVNISSEGEAIEKLNSNELSAYVLVPDDFINTMIHGGNDTLRYIYPENTATIGVHLTNEVIESVSPIVLSSERGVYAMMDYAFDRGDHQGAYEKSDELFLKYIDLVLKRSDIAEIEEMGIKNSLDITTYYYCGMILLFIMLFGIACSPLFSKKNIPMLKLLNSRGTSPLAVSLVEYIVFFVIAQLATTIVVTASALVLNEINVSVGALKYMSVIEIIGFSLKFVPVVALMTALQYLIFEVTKNIISSILLQFFLFIGMGYISGCFYPNYFFPESIRQISDAIPSGIAFDYMGNSIAGMDISRLLLVCIIYTVVFLLLAVSVKYNRVKR